jgi:hypothetical protein
MISNFYQCFISTNKNFLQVCTKFGIDLRLEKHCFSEKKRQKSREGKWLGGFCKKYSPSSSSSMDMAGRAEQGVATRC